MNKLFASCLLALVAASAASLCAVADDEREVGLLLGSEKVFADFCLAERNSITAAIKSQADGKTAQVFEIFFGAFTEIADEVLSVEQRAVQEFTRELKIPSGEQQAAEGELPEEEVQRLIEQGKREIQKQASVFGRLVAAGKSMVGSVLYNVANSAIFVRLAKARSYMNRDNLLYGIVHTCEEVAKFESKIAADLEAAKAELAKEHQDDAELAKSIQEMSVQQLKCYTTKYITRVNAFCDVFKNGATAFMKMLGLGSNYKLPSAVTTTPQ